MKTAVDDDLITRNPCRIKGAGKESAAERRIATVAQVDALADAIGIRWRLMVYLGAYGPMRPEELAGLHRRDVDVDNLVIRVRVAEPERTNGKRAPGPTKSDAGARLVVLPPFLRKEVRRHLDWFAEKGPDGLVFVGEKGAAFRRTTFGRKWRRAREVAGLPDGFRFYDLRHTGHTLSTRSGATLRDTMVRAGQSSERAALITSTPTRIGNGRSPPGSTTSCAQSVRSTTPTSVRTTRRNRRRASGAVVVRRTLTGLDNKEPPGR